MRKLFLLFILAFVILSCEKENELPPEYEYLIGNWVLDSYIVTEELDLFYSIKDTFPADSLGYNIQYSFNMSGFTEYIENTKVIESAYIESMDVNIVNNTSGNNGIGYFIHYRINGSNMTNELSLGLDYTHNIWKIYVKDYSCYNLSYTFVFKRD